MINADTRKLTMYVPVADIEKLRRKLRPDESITDLVKRLIREAAA